MSNILGISAFYHDSAAAILATSLLAGCSVFGIRSGYDAPAYTVDEFTDTYEVRTYEARLVADATVAATNRREGENAAFRQLFDYISGKNERAEKIAMTVPVETRAGGEKIAMTVPVETQSADGQVTMRFFFPDGFTPDTAPRPTDRRIALQLLAPERFAVITFSGFGGAQTVAEKEQELRDALDMSVWQVSGEASALYYDPPFTIPFLRRNEVIIPVTRRS